MLGRFLSPDPIVPNPANPQSLNRYSYVYNNPYRYTDPSGHCPFCIPVLIYAAGVVANTALDTAIDYSIAQLTGEEFHLGQSLAINAATNVALGGVGGIVGKARHLRHLQKLKNVRIAQAAPNPQAARKVAADLGLSPLQFKQLKEAQKTLVKPAGGFKRPRRKGYHVHHLVEVRFWERLGFETQTQAKQDIVGAEIGKELHQEITKKLREKNRLWLRG